MPACAQTGRGVDGRGAKLEVFVKLTPLDIRGKEFKRMMRGYIGADVDDFLEEIAEEFERLVGENIALVERCDCKRRLKRRTLLA